MKNLVLIFSFFAQLTNACAQKNILLQNKVIIEKQLKNWIASFNNFNFNNFTIKENSTFGRNATNSVEFDMELYHDLKPMFSISKNKQYIIDIFTNQMGPTKKGKKYYTNADDGGWVDIWDLKAKKNYPVFYNSMANWAEDSFWLTDNTFVLACIYNKQDVSKEPFFYFGNIKTKKLVRFDNTNKKCVQKKKGYRIKTPVPLVY